ncbi:hypothetical protein [Corynebacterium matruchotii]|uniref:hypothetical protein n=1 Tax=Corynebacterium matruchotii TaxID=43768 RepID=UPI0028E2F647|nr:hypothetical protein [Corynebacterium matruchotii]
MKQTRWWKYVTETIQGRTFKEAAKIAGFDQSAFTRWKDGAAAKPEFVVKFARAYNRNVLEALVEAEFITEQEAGLQKVNVPDIRSALRLAPEEWLADEVLKRMRAGAKTDELTAPLDELVARKQHKANELKPEPKPDVSTEVDHDAIIEQINAGKVKFAAQKHTPPLEENTP